MIAMPRSSATSSKANFASKPNPLLDYEQRNAEVLARYASLGTDSDPQIDSMLELVRSAFDVPIVFIALVASGKQRIISLPGIKAALLEGECAFLAKVLQQGKILTVLDASAHKHFKDEDLVRGKLGIRFYTGVPLVSPEGITIGSLSLIDTKPGAALGQKKKTILKNMAANIIQLLDSRLPEFVVPGVREVSGIELERNQQILNTVLENIEDAIIACDLDGNVVFFNDVTRELLNLPPEELTLDNWTKYCRLHHDDEETPLKAEEFPLYRAIQGEIIRNAELLLVFSDNESKWIRVSGNLMYGQDGEKLGAVVLMHDISQRKQAESAKRLSDQRFVSAFEYASHGMALIASYGRWMDANPALCQILGYSEEELLTTDIQSIVHPSELSCLINNIDKLLDQELDSFQIETRFMHQSGDVISILLCVSIVNRSSHRPSHFVAQIFDLTARNDTEAQLRQAQKLEALGQLTGGVAHDFNNLLTVILGNLEMAQRSKGNSERQEKFHGGAVSAVRSASKLTKRLLAFSRKQELAPELIVCDQFFKDMHELIRRTIGTHIELESHIDDNLRTIYIDAIQLESALLNLAINARDAMPEGGKLTITASNKKLDEHDSQYYSDLKIGDYLKITVSDSGHGMSEAVMDRIFQPFFTTKETGKGTGLGLSMVYGFVKQSGGHIKLYSEVGIGTSFKLYFPVADSQIEATTFDSPGKVVGGTEKILVVDDDDEVRKVLVFSLQQLGYQLMEADTSLTALEILEQAGGVNLVITDIVMPGGMNGIQFANEVTIAYPSIKVLFTSGFAQAAIERDQELEFGDQFLSKPFTRSELAQKVRYMLDAT